MKRFGTVLLFVCMMVSARSQKTSHAADLANTAMNLWKDSFLIGNDKVAKWRYDQGVILKGVEGLWNASGDARWFEYIRKSMDFYVSDEGHIKGYRPDEYNIDHVNNAKLLLLLYRVTGKDKYKKAATHLREQLRTHPRTSEGGFWHKKIYPGQMWLDGLYMGQPFYAEYAKIFHEDTAFNDIAKQFILMEKHSRDERTGLLYHGWDETRQQQWADKKTGLSPNIWGRALGWYGMAMVDVLDHFPDDHWGKDSIISILNRFAKAVTAVQDQRTGLWYDIPDKPHEPKNYFEASASSMLVYTLAKGVRKNYLPRDYLPVAKKAFQGIVSEFIKKENGQVNLHGTVAVSGLGGKPYRDGSFEYYMSEPVIVNDPKGIGAFINAAVEMEMLPTQVSGRGKKVLLDNFFNNEWKTDATGTPVRWHYTWDDKSNGGFAMLGEIFMRHGAQISSLVDAPAGENLKDASVYIIVDPDTEKENEKPNYMNEQYAAVISEWVKQGGVLLLLTNDNGNADLVNTNTLSKHFGVRFREDNFNKVVDNQYEQGLVTAAKDNPVFKTAKNLFIKELATLQISSPAKSVLSKNGKHISAVSRYGRGSVFITGDPWFYNEYIDGRRLPSTFDNYKAAQDLVKWSLMQVRKK